MNRRKSQLSFFEEMKRFFGGRLLHGRRRRARPLSKKEAMHTVLRSSWAVGPHSFLKKQNKNAIKAIIYAVAKKYGVKVYRLSIQGNHIHFVIRLTNRPLYNAFIRVLTSQIASHVMDHRSFDEFRRNLATTEIQGLGQRFWQFRPFTRILAWGRDFKTCCAYVLQNTLEALGFVDFKPRQNRYAKWYAETMSSTA